MSSTQFHMSDAILRGAESGMRVGMEAAMKSVLEEVVYKLSEKFGFDHKEALEFLGAVSLKKPKKSKKVQLPWCGMVITNCCQALKVNKGLHSQCLNDKVEEGDFCKSCQKDADKNGGTPSKGNATARLDPDYTDAKGKAPVFYGNYMKKEGITREAAEAEADKWGVTIPQEQFQVVDTKKGGNKKTSKGDTESASETDAASEDESVSETEVASEDGGSVSETEVASEDGSVSEPEEEPVEAVVEEPVEAVEKKQIVPDDEKDAKKKKKSEAADAKKKKKKSEAADAKKKKSEEKKAEKAKKKKAEAKKAEAKA